MADLTPQDQERARVAIEGECECHPEAHGPCWFCVVVDRVATAFAEQRERFLKMVADASRGCSEGDFCEAIEALDEIERSLEGADA